MANALAALSGSLNGYGARPSAREESSKVTCDLRGSRPSRRGRRRVRCRRRTISHRGDARRYVEQKHVNIATAEKIAQACVAEAKRKAYRVSVAIIDSRRADLLLSHGRPSKAGNSDGIYQGPRQRCNTRQPRSATAMLARVAYELRQWTFGNFAKAADANCGQWKPPVGAIGVGGLAWAPSWNDRNLRWSGLSKVMGKQPSLLRSLCAASSSSRGGTRLEHRKSRVR